MFRDEFKARYTTIPFAICETVCIGGKEVITHQHREVEIISMTAGAADFYINSEQYPVKAGDVLIIPPYALHRAQLSPLETTSYYCICFDLGLICDEGLKQGLEKQVFSDRCLIDGGAEYAERARGYISDAFHACEQRTVGWELMAVGNMSLLFGLLKQSEFFSGRTSSEKDSNFGKDAMTYIIDNYSSGITSRDAADALYMNYSCFCRQFKKTFGTCFTDYILAYRLEKAKIYLANTSLSVIEIAFRVGFNNCSYFCKAFRERYGSTPLAYRSGVKDKKTPSKNV